jgi:hypothetical protein
MLKDYEIASILKNFPNVELSYETNVNKKVYGADIILAIPEGKKCFAWFTDYKENNVCFLFELGDNKKITNVTIVQTSFADTLSYGTIFYGTLFKYDNISCFSVEDLLYYRGTNCSHISNYDKFLTIGKICKKEINQNVTHNKFLLFGLPLYVGGTSFNQLLNEIEVLPYKIKTIQFRFLYASSGEKSKKFFNMNYYKPGSNYKNINGNINYLEKAVFRIVPDIQNDIYQLYTYNTINGNGIQYDYYDIAFIPDYKTSVFMNRLFRKIKENENLDALEESDDEEEFESDKVDKFVYLDKTFHMNCVYNYKFKKWTPVSIAAKHEKVITKKQLLSNK